MRERGLYQIQLMKTRSSSGVGQKIELKFDVDTLRITDDGETAPKPQPSGNELLSQIKGVSNITGTNAQIQNTLEPISKNVDAVDVQSTKLKTMLAAIKQSKG
jgi:hypothetical protein